MTHPPGWTPDEPCPKRGSRDVTAYEIRIGADAIRTGWECRDCGHVATWIARPEGQASHAAEHRLLALMPLRTSYGGG